MAKKQKKKFKRKSDFDNRPKYCKFTSLGIEEIDFKDIKLLKEYITETGKFLKLDQYPVHGFVTLRT